MLEKASSFEEKLHALNLMINHLEDNPDNMRRKYFSNTAVQDNLKAEGLSLKIEGSGRVLRGLENEVHETVI